MTAMSAQPSAATWSAAPAGLRPVQLAWLAAAVFVVAAGYGALLPLLPGWLTSLTPGAPGFDISRHVGFLSGVYAAGVLVGAPLWGLVSDRAGRGRILIVGLVGYVVSVLLLLVPGWAGLWGIYALRGTSGFFVAAIVPVVSALVAEYTPKEQRARRFAWLSAMSLLGFLFGPALSAVADAVGTGMGDGTVTPLLAVRIVLALSALLGGVTMLGLALTLPPTRASDTTARSQPATSPLTRRVAMLWLNGALMFVLAGFELGIVLQGQQQADQSSRQAAIMFAECSLVMLGVNALLFFTGALEKIPARMLIGAGLILAVIGLAVMAVYRTDAWMYLGVSLTSAGTGLALPVIAYLAAGTSPLKLGATMGGLAAAAGFGQALGSATGGWLFGALAQRSFGWLTVPLLVILGLLLAPSAWWSSNTAESSRPDAKRRPHDV